MPSVDVDSFRITFDVSFPFITCTVYFVVPSIVPHWGGNTYELGTQTLSLTNPSVDIPYRDGAISADVSLTLNPSFCTFSVDGSLSINAILKKFYWSIHTVISYAAPFSLTEPWANIQLDRDTLQNAINAAPPQSVGSEPGTPSLDGSPETQSLIRDLLAFYGCGGLADDMIAAARSLEQTFTRTLAHRQGADGEGDAPVIAAESKSKVLLALGFGASAGIGLGLSGSCGFYFTGDAEIGIFGSGGFNQGILGGIEAGAVVFCYWSENGKSAKENFQGLNGYVSVDGGEGVAIGLTFFFPEASVSELSSHTPCGVGVNVGAGFGIPVNFFVGNSDTFVAVVSPPQLQEYVL